MDNLFLLSINTDLNLNCHTDNYVSYTLCILYYSNSFSGVSHHQIR